MVMKFIPSPIPIQFKLLFTATANKSGRMQYHKIQPGRSKTRISRNEFIEAYNTQHIIAMKPLQDRETPGMFQFEFYT
ncbi:MAG TPA: hypothetical protein PLM35_07060 [Cyclobacteriaceae bacterium]|nr:hypothetical protein [Cyclobacteriaceae bacterium]